ncbi:MAG: hypothetical protein ACRDIA_07610, partial [Actinomycetota bacterium]
AQSHSNAQGKVKASAANGQPMPDREEEGEMEVATAGEDGAGLGEFEDGQELLASARSPSPGSPVAVSGLAILAGLAAGAGLRRRGSRGEASLATLSADLAQADVEAGPLRRLRGQW